MITRRFDRSICRFGIGTTGFAVAVALGASACGESKTAAPAGTDAGIHEDAGPEPGSAADAASLPALAADAFVWGFPLVVSERTLQNLGGLVGVDKLFNQTALTTPAIRVIVAPNQDTLYSISVLDLRNGPMVLTVPDVSDRYWTYQFLDVWTNSFHYLGTRATGGKGGTFAITPPGFQGPLPNGTELIASPTPELFLLGRYLVRDTADIPNVTALDRTLVPLTPDAGSPPPLGAPPGKPEETGTTGAAFFDELGDALAANPPATPEDRRELARFEALGIGPGKHPADLARTAADSAALTLLENGVTDGQAQIQKAASGASTEVNGWTTHLDIGTYTGDFLLRAVIAKLGWGANVPQEAVYPISNADGAGVKYTGAKNYVMHFDAGNLPPVDPTNGFWSLTLYGPDRFFVENAIHRYAIGDRTPGLTRNPDDSLDLYVQNAAPTGKEGNWLPAPPGEFVLMLRLYLPDQSVLDGKYAYPAVAEQ